MFEVYYCVASTFSTVSYSTGSQRFNSPDEFVAWLESEIKPVLITGFKRLT